MKQVLIVKPSLTSLQMSGTTVPTLTKSTLSFNAALIALSMSFSVTWTAKFGIKTGVLVTTKIP